jgi:nucleoside 2-deoxyribosyltransferase
MLNIVGGTYYESCIQPFWDEVFGSGLRAVLALNHRTDLKFYTYSDPATKPILEGLSDQLNFQVEAASVFKNVEFTYEHPLSNPSYYPHDSDFDGSPPIVVETAEPIICYGMVEGNALVKGDKVVYDPQDPGNAKPFHKNGSTANQLLIVLNYGEACAMSGEKDMERIKNYFINTQKAHAVIVKNGAEGAFLMQQNDIHIIPSYITDKVWPIGSGDIFTATVGYEWMIKKQSLLDAAHAASMAAAFYVDSRTLPIPFELPTPYLAFRKPSNELKTVYLAGPFFTMGQRWVINQFRDALLKTGLAVFSPFHDVGIGEPEKVAPLDLKGVDECDIVLAIADGLDAGTLFEIGYARAKGKHVLIFVESEKNEALTMLKGSNCLFENDFSTIVYKTLWQAYKK